MSSCIDHMRIDVRGGSEIGETIDALVGYAQSHGCEARGEFNGVDIIAFPWDASEGVGARYDRDREISRAERAAEPTKEQTLDALVERVLEWRKINGSHARLRAILEETT